MGIQEVLLIAALVAAVVALVLSERRARRAEKALHRLDLAQAWLVQGDFDSALPQVRKAKEALTGWKERY